MYTTHKLTASWAVIHVAMDNAIVQLHTPYSSGGASSKVIIYFMFQNLYLH